MEVNRDELLKELTQLFWANDEAPEESSLEALAHFAELVIEKNEVLNLVSRKDIDSIIENHVFISAFIAHHIPKKCKSFVDIGTGGGFPGIPIAIMRNDMNGVLVDSISKKTNAVKEFVESLLLKNVKVENSRIESEEFINKYKYSFDVVLSRATVPLLLLVRYAMPIVKNRAYLLAFKGGDLTEEFEKVHLKYGSNIRKSTTFELHYKPNNMKNEKGKKLVFMELYR